jgi:hypothetical protein
MQEAVPENKIGIYPFAAENWTEVYAYSQHWPCLFPQHGLGKKHTRPILLEDWQKELVAAAPQALLLGLYHSDGCRSLNSDGRGWEGWRYKFDNLSGDIRSLFVDTCQVIGLSSTTSKNTIYVSKAPDVAAFDKFAGPKQ